MSHRRLYLLEDEKGRKYITIANNECEARQNITVDFDLIIGTVKITNTYELGSDISVWVA